MNNGDSILVIALVLSICSIALTLVALGVASIALIRSIAVEKSTHSVQYVPIDPEIDKANTAFLKNSDQWATNEANISKDYRLYKEELEDTMPEFFEEDDRVKVKLSL